MAIIREFSPAPVRGLRLFTAIPDGFRVVKVRHFIPGSLYSAGMHVIVDPSCTDLVEGVDVARIVTGGPRDGFDEVAVVCSLRHAFGGWCTAPGGFGHSQLDGGARPLTLLNGPIRAKALQKTIIGHVVGCLGDEFGNPLRELWPVVYQGDGPLKSDAMDMGDLPPTYVMQCDGVCLEPVFKDGSKLIFDATNRVSVGDVAAFWLKPSCTLETYRFQAMVKRLVTPLPDVKLPFPERIPAPPVIIVEMDNPAQRFVVPLDRIMAVHKCGGVYKGPRWKPSREEMRKHVANAQAMSP